MQKEFDLKVTSDVSVNNEVLDNMRASLRGQRLLLEKKKAQLQNQDHISRAEAEFGLSFTKDQISDRVRFTLKRRLVLERIAKWSDLYAYDRTLIPDTALLRLKEAQESNLFHDFYVVEPRYEAKAVTKDPWLVGRVYERYIVLAYWED